MVWIRKSTAQLSGVHRYTLPVALNPRGEMEAASFLAAVKLKLPVYFGVDGNAAFTLYEFDKNSTTEIAMQKKRA